MPPLPPSPTELKHEALIYKYKFTHLHAVTSSNEETMVLAPPSTVTVLEGNTLLLPCVSSGPSTPSFSRILTESITSESVSNGVSSNGLEIVGITTSDAGVYTCTVGSVSVMTMVTVTFGKIDPRSMSFYYSELY